MALTLPTSTDTPGSFSSSAVGANVNASFTRDAKFTVQSGAGEKSGIGGAALSANGDYIVVGNRAPGAVAHTHASGGFPYVLTRTGNTFTTQTTLTSNTNHAVYSQYGNGPDTFGAYDDNPHHRSVSIDEAGETIAVTGGNYGHPDAGRTEIFERTGSTWNRVFANGGETNSQIGYYGTILSGDGNRCITAGKSSANGRSKNYIFHKTGSTWAYFGQLNTPTSGQHAQFGIAGNIVLDNAGEKFCLLNDGQRSGQGNNNTDKVVKIFTGRYNTSSNLWNISAVQTYDQSGQHASMAQALGMSKDGNYLGIYFRHHDSDDNAGRVAILKWNSSTNSWDQQAVVSGQDGATDDGATIGRSMSFNYDGSILVLSGNAAGGKYWYTFERSGSTWSLLKKQNVTSGLSGNYANALSSDGKHLILTAWAAFSNEGSVEYWVPTGTIPSNLADGTIHTHQGRKFKWNAGKGRWRPEKASDRDNVSSTRNRNSGVGSAILESDNDLVIDGVTVSVDAFAGRTETYANASIFPFSNLQSGDQAIALDTGYLYVTDGSGWFKVANSQPV